MDDHSPRARMVCKVKGTLGRITMNKSSWGDGIPAELFQILKLLLWKCWSQNASKFGKLSCGHRTGKGQFTFQSQRKAMPKNVQTTTQLHLFHTLAKKCSKFSKLGFNSMWTKNFQMFKLDLEKAEDQRWNYQHSLDHRKCRRIPEKHLLHWLHQSFWLCGSEQTMENT